MDHIHLSKRLQAIRAFIEPNERLADIGTDHAFLPIDLVQRGIIKFAVASDIGAGPVAIAKQNVADAGLTDQISVRQADGLAGIHCDCRNGWPAHYEHPRGRSAAVGWHRDAGTGT